MDSWVKGVRLEVLKAGKSKKLKFKTPRWSVASISEIR